MGISSERREWIEKLANDALFDNLSESEFDALTDEDHDQPMREFLASVAEPEELHLFAKLCNWDGSIKDLQSVIRHPLCDQGTALLVYWRGQPGYYFQYADRSAVPEHEREVFDLLREIEQRVTRGAYPAALQPFDPADDEGRDHRPKPARMQRYSCDVPAVMYLAVPRDAASDSAASDSAEDDC